MNLAPVADINNNPDNPVIADRSLGDDRFRVARQVVWIAKGMEAAGVAACAKHFPGHGDTDVDSHHDLPVISHSKARLDSLELLPFKELVANKVSAIMIAHLHVPALDSAANRPTTLSEKVISTLLRDSMGYQGVIMTDALNMKGVTKFFEPGVLEVEALKAGNDILLFSAGIPKAIENIKKAIAEKKLTQARIDSSVLRILKLKQRLGIHQNRLVDNPDAALKNIHTAEGQELRKKLFRSAITLAKNKGQLLPFTSLQTTRIACITLGRKNTGDFLRTLQKYAPVTHENPFSNKLAGYSHVIVAVYGLHKYANGKFGLPAIAEKLFKTLEKQHKQIILVCFGSPYVLEYIGNYADAAIIAYEENTETEIAAAEVVMGGSVPVAKLPVKPRRFEIGQVIPRFSAPIRFGFNTPGSVGFDTLIFGHIDTLLTGAVTRKGTPGGAVLVLKSGQVVLEKGFGKTEYTTADSTKVVDPLETIYDLASVTKVMATTLAAMYLWEKKQLDLQQTVGHYLADYQGSAIAPITVIRLLEHTSGLPPVLSYWQKTTKPESPYRDLFGYKAQDSTLEIANGFYMHKRYLPVLQQLTKEARVRATGKVVYSDVNFILLGQIIEKISGQRLDSFCDNIFYRPMGMNNTLFNPATKIDTNRIAPTEIDTYWRMTTVRGFVHDQSAAVFGGVAGNAGLFSNVYDIAKVLWMLTHKGQYGGIQYLKPETIDYFTRRRSSSNPRGLGWDKPIFALDHYTPCSKRASRQTFGHLGFTGTAVWADPENELLFIFLSNRTYPNSDNITFIKEKIRLIAQDFCYDALIPAACRNIAN
jgi:beta-glucosidase-like glycosyl hydrolase/CubicO group peptidase (beta-lactamase class C family)